MKVAIFAFWLCGFASGVVLAQDHVESQRQAIAAARTKAQAEFAAQEAVCAKRFAVTACMDDVAARRRASNKDLARQEAELNQAERVQRATEQLQRLDDKARERQDRDAAADGGIDAQQEKLQQQRDKQAQHRAQASKAEAHSVASPSGLSASAQAANREAFAQKQKAAKERKAARDKRLREATQPPKPLPTPP